MWNAGLPYCCRRVSVCWRASTCALPCSVAVLELAGHGLTRSTWPRMRMPFRPVRWPPGLIPCLAIRAVGHKYLNRWCVAAVLHPRVARVRGQVPQGMGLQPVLGVLVVASLAPCAPSTSTCACCCCRAPPQVPHRAAPQLLGALLHHLLQDARQEEGLLHWAR